MEDFAGRAGVVQRVLAGYRVPLFDGLAVACRGGLSVFAGDPGPEDGLRTPPDLKKAHRVRARNRYLMRGKSTELVWQTGLMRWLRESNPDALVIEANPRYIVSRWAVRWMHRRGRPVIAWGLGTLQLSAGLHALRQHGRNRFLRRFDGLIAYSSRAASQYVTEVGFDASRVFVARNATTPRPAQLPPERPDHFNGRPTVLFVGRINPGKRVDMLLHACAALPETLRPNLLIVGEGDNVDELKALAAREYPAAQFTGARFGAELAETFRAADVFVLPGLGGLAIQEAMSYGLPVIVGEADGTQDDLVRPQNGWALPPNDQAALNRALQDALSDVARLRAMGRESYRIVAQEINLEAMVETFVRALNAVTAAKGRPGKS